MKAINREKVLFKRSKLAQSPAQRIRLGKKGRAYALAHWSAAQILDQCCQRLKYFV